MRPDHTDGHYGAEEGPETNQKHRQTFHEEKLKRASLLTTVWTGKRAEGHGENYLEAQGKQGWREHGKTRTAPRSPGSRKQGSNSKTPSTLLFPERRISKGEEVKGLVRSRQPKHSLTPAHSGGGHQDRAEKGPAQGQRGPPPLSSCYTAACWTAQASLRLTPGERAQRPSKQLQSLDGGQE